jgi:hypothetical protein
MKKTIIIPLCVFVIAAGAQFLMNGNTVFDTSWSTWQVIINSGIVAVVGWVIVYAGAIKADLEGVKEENAVLRKLVRGE